MYYKDVTIEVEDSEQAKIYNDFSILVNDSLLVFQLDGKVKELMEGELNGQINGITIIHLPIEGGVKPYSEALTELINYIIYDQQNDIVNDQLFIINKEDPFHQETVKVIKENQKKITKNNYELFPKDDTSCIQADPASFHVTFQGENEHLYYYGEFELEVSDELIELSEGDEVDLSGDTYYEYVPVIEPSEGDESSSDSESSNNDEEESEPEAVKIEDLLDLVSDENSTELVLAKIKAKAQSSQSSSDSGDGGSGGTVSDVIVQEHWKKETYTLPLKGMFSQTVGTLNNAVQSSENKIVISRLVNPDYYNIIPDADSSDTKESEDENKT